MAIPIPFVTFQLHTVKKKETGQNCIKWRCPINEELLANGDWALAIKSICLNNVKEEAPGNFKDIRNAQVSVNLVKNDINWYLNMRRFVGSSEYPEWHPVLHTHFDMNKNDLIFLSKEGDNHKINHITSDLEVVLEPINSTKNSTVNMKHLTCEAIILISLYKLYKY